MGFWPIGARIGSNLHLLLVYVLFKSLKIIIYTVDYFFLLHIYCTYLVNRRYVVVLLIARETAAGMHLWKLYFTKLATYIGKRINLETVSLWLKDHLWNISPSSEMQLYKISIYFICSGIYHVKGPCQPHLCFCSHARISLWYFIRGLSKRRKITVELLKIIKPTFWNTAYSKTIRIRFTMLYQ